MRVYVNGIDGGDARVDKRETALGMIKVMYHEAMFPTYYPADKCTFTTRFGKRCMIFGGDYSERDIIEINEQYMKHIGGKEKEITRNDK